MAHSFSQMEAFSFPVGQHFRSIYSISYLKKFPLLFCQGNCIKAVMVVVTVLHNLLIDQTSSAPFQRVCQKLI